MIVFAFAAEAKQLSSCTWPVAEFYGSETMEIFWLPHYSGDYVEVVTICFSSIETALTKLGGVSALFTFTFTFAVLDLDWRKVPNRVHNCLSSFYTPWMEGQLPTQTRLPLSGAGLS